MKCKVDDAVRLHNFPDQGPFIIEEVIDNISINSYYLIDFGDGLEITYEDEVFLDIQATRELKINDILD